MSTDGMSSGAIALDRRLALAKEDRLSMTRPTRWNRCSAEESVCVECVVRCWVLAVGVDDVVIKGEDGSREEGKAKLSPPL
jgi:hypothetical protein